MKAACRKFLEDFSQWASRQPNILAVALVGSHARNEATDLSDIDLVVIATAPETYLEHAEWAQRFGTIARQQIEHYGDVISLRVWYAGSHEVEYGFTNETWAAEPLDTGTRDVLLGGFEILFDRASILSRIVLLAKEDSK